MATPEAPSNYTIDLKEIYDPSAAHASGIPAAKFIEDVATFVDGIWKQAPPQVQVSPEGDKTQIVVAEAIGKALQEAYGKYKFMEQQLVRQKSSLIQKSEEIQTALDVLGYVGDKNSKSEPVAAQFELSDAVYVKAEVEASDKVMLWVGSGVMVEYSHEEAHELLTTNLDNAKKTLASLESELEFLKDQITICEVSVSRVHNHKVAEMESRKKAAVRK